MIRIEKATLAHADRIAANLRESDRLEVMASHGHNPFEACRASVLVSRFAYCALADGVPFYLFGLRTGTAVFNTASIWALGTDELRRHAKTFWPASQNFVAFCRGHADELSNYVDCRNTASIAWLKRLGFQFEEPAAHGVQGRDFMRFSMKGGFLSV